MATFILIHGALHGGWCWAKLEPLLRAAGHATVAPDLPGMGDGDGVPAEAVTLDLWAGFTVDLIERAAPPVILVGHSRGGIVIGEAAERVPDRLAGIVYLTAMLVPPGKCGLEMSGVDVEVFLAALPEDRRMRFDPEGAIGFFYNTSDPAEARAAAARLKPEPIAPSLTPTGGTPERWGRVPRAYIQCAQDKALPLATQQTMQEAAPCDPVITLDTDHSPFLCAPELLADALLAIAAEWEPAHA